jgi:hypothetical protein
MKTALLTIFVLAAGSFVGANLLRAQSTSATWTLPTSGGTWETGSNWSTSPNFAGGAGNTASFTNAYTASDTVTLTAAETIGALNISPSATTTTFTLNNTGSGALTIDNGSGASGSGTITVAGSTTSAVISAPLTIAGGLVKAGAGGLTLSGAVTWNGSANLTGTLTLSTNTAGIVINGVTGAGRLIYSGTNTLTVEGNNTGFSGTVGNGAGTLKAVDLTTTASGNVTGSDVLGTGTMTAANNGTLQLRANGDGTTAAQVVALGGNLILGSSVPNFTIDVNNNTAGSNKTLSLGGLNFNPGVATGTINFTGGNGYNFEATNTTALNIGGSGAETEVLNPTTASFIAHGNVTVSNTTGAVILDLDGTSSANAITGVISNASSGGFTTSVAKTNSSTWTLSGTNSYTGSTTVSAGTLNLASTGVLAAGSTVAVNGGTFNDFGNVKGAINVATGAKIGGSGNTAIGGALTIAGGGIVNLVDGSIGTLNGSTLTLSAPGGNGNVALDIELNASGADQISFTGAATLGNDFTVNLTGLSGAASGTYTIATASGGTMLASDFTAGSLGGTLASSGDSIAFIQNGNSVELVLGGSVASTSYYFTGSAGTNNFTTAGNYFTAASGGTAQTAALSSTSNVFLNATSPTPTNTPDTLTGAATINSLTYLTGGTSLAGTGTLTLGASLGTGVTDSATGGTTETLSPQVALGASQSWTVSNSTNTLAVGGGVTGTSGQTLTLNGPGKFVFSSGASSGGYNTTVSSGTLLISNSSGSALGTGTFTVARGAGFGGSGILTGLAAVNIGTTGSSGTTQVQVGSGGSNTSTSLTISASTGTITNTNLTFNLNSATNTGANAGNKLVLSGAPMNFSNSTLTLNIVGSNIIGADTAYVLVTDSSGFSGLTTSGPNDVITAGLSIATSQFFTANGTYAAGFYNGSYLFVGGGGTEIEVEVVPEPSTWALMLGGFGFLAFYLRRKNQRMGR